MTARFGFQDRPDVPATLRLAARLHWVEGSIDLDEAPYSLSQITVVPGVASGMWRWRTAPFLLLAHRAAGSAGYFGLPDDRTVTMGARIEP